MSKKYYTLLLGILVGTLGMGFSSVANADMKWFESMRGFCPTVCQGTDYKFAMPSGIHKKTGKPYYICAVNYGVGNTGWRAGYNIDWGAVKEFCYAQWHKRDSGKNSYQEHYLCLCSKQQIPPMTNEMVIRNRR